jgi:pimeloyl-ACP methyl ester carboxylesterase
MSRYFASATLCVLISFFSVAFAPAQDAEKKPPRKEERAGTVEGTWLFVRRTHLSSVTILVTFSKKGDSFGATIDYPELRMDQKFSFVAVKDDTVVINEFGFSPIFEAKMTGEKKSTLEGKMLYGNIWRPMALTRLEKRPEFPRPQEPARPYPYDAEDVTFKNEKAEITLAGTLTLPRGATGPCPAVVLVSGSGPDGRDYLNAGHYRYLVLADYLTRKGMAVLRVDDRGVGKSKGNFSNANLEDFTQDAEAAVKFLQSRKEVDANRIGLIGHSDGGSAAALAASRGPEIAFIVLLAAPGVPGDQIMLRQTEQGLKALGANEERVAWNLSLQKGVVEIVKREAEPEKANKALHQYLEDVEAKLNDEDRKRLGIDKEKIAVAGSVVWLRKFVTADPRPVLAKVRCPVLALNGDKDLIVWSKDNLQGIEQALKQGGNKNYAIQEMPGLNHMFQMCKTGAPYEYVWIDETIDPAALDRINNWIAKSITKER